MPNFILIIIYLLTAFISVKPITSNFIKNFTTINSSNIVSSIKILKKITNYSKKNNSDWFLTNNNTEINYLDKDLVLKTITFKKKILDKSIKILNSNSYNIAFFQDLDKNLYLISALNFKIIKLDLNDFKNIINYDIYIFNNTNKIILNTLQDNSNFIVNSFYIDLSNLEKVVNFNNSLTFLKNQSLNPKTPIFNENFLFYNNNVYQFESNLGKFEKIYNSDQKDIIIWFKKDLNNFCCLDSEGYIYLNGTKKINVDNPIKKINPLNYWKYIQIFNNNIYYISKNQLYVIKDLEDCFTINHSFLNDINFDNLTNSLYAKILILNDNKNFYFINFKNNVNKLLITFDDWNNIIYFSYNWDLKIITFVNNKNLIIRLNIDIKNFINFISFPSTYIFNKNGHFLKNPTTININQNNQIVESISVNNKEFKNKTLEINKYNFTYKILFKLKTEFIKYGAFFNLNSNNSNNNVLFNFTLVGNKLNDLSFSSLATNQILVNLETYNNNPIYLQQSNNEKYGIKINLNNLNSFLIDKSYYQTAIFNKEEDKIVFDNNKILLKNVLEDNYLIFKEAKIYKIHLENIFHNYQEFYLEIGLNNWAFNDRYKVLAKELKVSYNQNQENFNIKNFINYLEEYNNWLKSPFGYSALIDDKIKEIGLGYIDKTNYNFLKQKFLKNKLSQTFNKSFKKTYNNYLDTEIKKFLKNKHINPNELLKKDIANAIKDINFPINYGLEQILKKQNKKLPKNKFELNNYDNTNTTFHQWLLKQVTFLKHKNNLMFIEIISGLVLLFLIIIIFINRNFIKSIFYNKKIKRIKK